MYDWENRWWDLTKKNIHIVSLDPRIEEKETKLKGVAKDLYSTREKYYRV